MSKNFPAQQRGHDPDPKLYERVTFLQAFFFLPVHKCALRSFHCATVDRNHQTGMESGEQIRYQRYHEAHMRECILPFFSTFFFSGWVFCFVCLIAASLNMGPIHTYMYETAFFQSGPASTGGWGRGPHTTTVPTEVSETALLHSTA